MRGDILSAAADLFLAQGFATSMDAVAAHARVSKRTLYARFPSKQALYEAVLGWLSGDLIRPATHLSPDLPLDQALLLFCQSLLELYTRPKVVAFAQLIIKESARFPELDRATRHQFEENILLPLAAFLDTRPEIAADVNTQLAAQILCAVATTEITRMHAENDLAAQDNFSRLMKSTIDYLMDGIRHR